MGVVYLIEHLELGKKYIGSSIVPRLRKNTHFYQLRKGKHHNSYLQAFFSKYSESAFEWRVLDETNDESELREREKYWIKFFNTTDRDKGFNLTEETIAFNLGKKASEEAKRMMSLRTQGSGHPRSKLSEEDIDKVFRLSDEGKTTTEIASMFGVSQSNISLILSGKSWSHLGKQPIKRNKSGCVGVYQHRSGKWIAEIIRDGQYKRLGSFTEKEGAIKARKEAEGGALWDMN